MLIDGVQNVPAYRRTRVIVGLLAMAVSGCGSPPPAAELRSASLERNAAAIREECRRAANGDWPRWEAETSGYRDALKARIDRLRTFDAAETARRKGKSEPLAGRADFPLFEIEPADNLVHIYDPSGMAEFRRKREVVAAQRWLRARGIDLIFVPVPKMAEVYAEEFIDPCPPDGVLAPHLRQALLELLESDVEVVDVFALFRPERQPNPEYLYNTADTHWAPRGMRIAAREIARRVARYDFGSRARSAPAVVSSAPGPFDIHGPSAGMTLGDMPFQGGWLTLTDAQRTRAERAQTRTCEQVTLPGARVPSADPSCPLYLVGNSYGFNFRELLIKETNLLLRSGLYNGMTTEVFGDFLRAPEALDGVRVMVWLTTEQQMCRLKPMPDGIMAALDNAR
jgi:hypothetical protein